MTMQSETTDRNIIDTIAERVMGWEWCDHIDFLDYDGRHNTAEAWVLPRTKTVARHDDDGSTKDFDPLHDANDEQAVRVKAAEVLTEEQKTDVKVELDWTIGRRNTTGDRAWTMVQTGDLTRAIERVIREGE